MTINLADCPYTDEIRRSMEAYLPQWPWQYGAAQLYQESRWEPTAKNARSGAMGIAQFMPDTWTGDVIEGMGFIDIASAYDPVYAIPAYGWYMRKQREKWTAPRPEEDRRRLAMASYNAGFGNLLKAQRRANNAPDYASIIAALPQVTGEENAKETREYVEHIERWYSELTA